MRVCIRLVYAVVAFSGLAVVTGCGTTGAPPRPAPAPHDAPHAPAAVVTAPADGAVDVPAAAEVRLSGATATTAVTVTDASGTTVAGALRPDRSSWVPATSLGYDTTYTVSLDAAKRVTFRTMSRPAKLVRVSTPLSDDAVYGVGMPLVVDFGTPVPPEQRAAVERRLFVTSVPDQAGGWNWFSGSEVHYRPREYWQEGTKLSLRVATGGLPMGGDAYGAADLTIRAAIGDKVVMVTDNATKTMTVTRHDEVLRTIPVSLGKSGKPSSSGAMVVMAKAQSELFVGTDPGDSYRTTVYWTQRLTDGGEYVHAAPWSVDDQGRRNVSHGCTNMSTDNAKWLWGLTHMGDPVIVKGTGTPLEWGNGWTDWDRPWDRYAQGSALPAASS